MAEGPEGSERREEIIKALIEAGIIEDTHL
jgi:hypothetical protein